MEDKRQNINNQMKHILEKENIFVISELTDIRILSTTGKNSILSNLANLSKSEAENKINPLKNLKETIFKNAKEFEDFSKLAELFQLIFNTFYVQEENYFDNKKVNIKEIQDKNNVDSQIEPVEQFFVLNNSDKLYNNQFELDFDLYLKLNEHQSFDEAYQNYISYMFMLKDEDNYDELLCFCLQYKNKIQNILNNLLSYNSLAFLGFNELMYLGVILQNTKLKKEDENSLSYSLKFDSNKIDLQKLQQIKLFKYFQDKQKNIYNIFLQENLKIQINSILSFQSKLCFVYSFTKKLFEHELVLQNYSNIPFSVSEQLYESSNPENLSFEKTSQVLDYLVLKNQNFLDESFISECAQNSLFTKKLFSTTLNLTNINKENLIALKTYSSINPQITVLDLALMNTIPSFYIYSNKNLFKNDETEFVSESVNKLTASFMAGNFTQKNSSIHQQSGIIQESKMREEKSIMEIEVEDQDPLVKTHQQVQELENNMTNFLLNKLNLSENNNLQFFWINNFAFKFLQSFSKYDIGFNRQIMKNNLELNELIEFLKNKENLEADDTSKNWTNKSPANEDLQPKSHLNNNQMLELLLSAFRSVFRNKVQDYQLDYEVFNNSLFIISQLSFEDPFNLVEGYLKEKNILLEILKMQIYIKNQNYQKLFESIYFVFEYFNVGNMINRNKVFRVLNSYLLEKEYSDLKYSQNFILTDFLNLLLNLVEHSNELLLQLSSIFLNPKLNIEDLKVKYFEKLIINLNANSSFEVFLEITKLEYLSKKSKNSLSKLFLKKIFDENLTFYLRENHNNFLIKFIHIGFCNQLKYYLEQLKNNQVKNLHEILLNESIISLETLMFNFFIFSKKNNLLNKFIKDCLEFVFKLIMLLLKSNALCFKLFVQNVLKLISLYTRKCNNIIKSEIVIDFSQENLFKENLSDQYFRNFLESNKISYRFCSSSRKLKQISKIFISKKNLSQLSLIIQLSLELFAKKNGEIPSISSLDKSKQKNLKSKNLISSNSKVNKPMNYDEAFSYIKSNEINNSSETSFVKNLVYFVMSPHCLFNLLWSLGRFYNCLMIAQEFEDETLLNIIMKRLTFKFLSLSNKLKVQKLEGPEILSIQAELKKIEMQLHKVVLINLSNTENHFYIPNKNLKLDLFNIFIKIQKNIFSISQTISIEFFENFIFFDDLLKHSSLELLQILLNNNMKDLIDKYIETIVNNFKKNLLNESNKDFVILEKKVFDDVIYQLDPVL